MFFKFKPVSFTLSVISLIICIVNYMGYDNKDMILFFTSPPLWLSKTEWFAENIGTYKDVPIFLKYIFTITFWSLVGERIDRRRSATKDSF